ncbi:hypothetical protein Anapl_00757 [Anas platyrhynchos]|uniref:Uncharacterized protein n=1 Tax=Anas platyrhynchos TaxID=8839 RepID=R0LJ82_ANAPL|nr:hypothetical protein Anapl_00757 [Anas platyrhynchos]
MSCSFQIEDPKRYSKCDVSVKQDTRVCRGPFDSYDFPTSQVKNTKKMLQVVNKSRTRSLEGQDPVSLAHHKPTVLPSISPQPPAAQGREKALSKGTSCSRPRKSCKIYHLHPLREEKQATFDAAAVAEQFAINLTPAAQAAAGPRPRLRPGGSRAPQTSSDPNTGLRTLITLLQKHKATANLRIAGFVSQVLQEALAGMFSPHRPLTTSSKGLPLPPRPRSPTLPLLATFHTLTSGSVQDVIASSELVCGMRWLLVRDLDLRGKACCAELPMGWGTLDPSLLSLQRDSQPAYPETLKFHSSSSFDICKINQMQQKQWLNQRSLQQDAQERE